MPQHRSTMYSLGLFFRHIVRGVVADPAAPSGNKRTVLRHDVHEQSQHTPAGKVTLRRTTIEELELDSKPPPPVGDAHDQRP